MFMVGREEQGKISVQAGERKSWNPRLKNVLPGPTLSHEILMVLKAPPLRRVL